MVNNPETSLAEEALEARDIVVAYKLMLARHPRNDEIEAKLKNVRSLDHLRRMIMGSPEYSQKAPKQTYVSRGKRYDATQSIIHLHMPKTAGSSLSEILGRNFAADEKISFGEDDDALIARYPFEERRKLKLLHGHLRWGAASYLPQDCHYLTVLREPVARLASLYGYIKRTPNHPQHEEVASQNMSFGTYLEYADENPASIRETDNGQIRRIAGNTTKSMDRRSMCEVFEDALANIFAPNMTYGLTEYFGDFLHLLEAKGIIKEGKNLKRNVAPNAVELGSILSDLTPRQHDILAFSTEWDKKFYDICKNAYFARTP